MGSENNSSLAVLRNVYKSIEHSYREILKDLNDKGIKLEVLRDDVVYTFSLTSELYVYDLTKLMDNPPYRYALGKFHRELTNLPSIIDGELISLKDLVNYHLSKNGCCFADDDVLLFYGDMDLFLNHEIISKKSYEVVLPFNSYVEDLFYEETKEPSEVIYFFNKSPIFYIKYEPLLKIDWKSSDPLYRIELLPTQLYDEVKDYLLERYKLQGYGRKIDDFLSCVAPDIYVLLSNYSR